MDKYGAINVKRTTFSETVKTLLTFLSYMCDTAVAVPLQPIVSCCAEVFILVNNLYLVIPDGSIRLGWRALPKINAHVFGFVAFMHLSHYTTSRLTQDHGHGQLRR